jgi:hypothetical protein
MTRVTVQKIRRLDEERAKLLAAAKSEAIKKVDQALKELNSLGFSYRLVGDNVRATGPKSLRKKAGRVRGRVKNERCRICNFLTVPPHDARTHRSQSKKAPFTHQELGKRGLRRA